MTLRTYSVLRAMIVLLMTMVYWDAPLLGQVDEDQERQALLIGSSAMRAVPLNCPVGEPISLEIEVNPDNGVLVYAVEETPPMGWAVSGVNEAGIFDEGAGKVKWGPFFDNASRSLKYTVTPPIGWSGRVNFSGNASFDGVGTAIGGEDQCVTAPVFAPVIDLQPKSQRVGLSGAVTLSVSASGVGALTYQWAKDGVDLPGETESVLSLTEIETSDAGEYRVAVTDSLGTVVSDVARLTVSLSNATRALPETFSQGVLAVITIEANPESGVLTYAVEETPPAGWSIGAINEGGVYDGISGTVKWGPFFDGSARTLTYEASAPTTGSGSASFQGVASFDGFSVVIGGDAQRSVSGDVAPIIVTQPANQNLFLGSNATLCVGAAGSGVLSYQWAKDGIDLPGETSRCLNLSDIEPGDSGEYRVAVTDSRGTTVSQGARLIVALSSATRTLPEDCLEGRPTPVTIEARPEANVLSYAIEETPPAGWSIEVINEGGVYDATTGSVKWGPFFDAQPRTLTYEASAPTGATGMGRFEGVASYDGFSAPIAGNAQCRVISSTCLEIGLRDGFVVIEFCKPKLYSAESVAGPFKEIVGASSPYLAPITDTQKFFMAMD